METYFAYRLPQEQTIHFYKGKGEWIADLTDCPETGFLFHSFNGDRILLVRNPEPISLEEFSLKPLLETGTETPKTTYFEQFKSLKEAIHQGDFEKIILSRTKIVPTSKNGLSLFERLNQTYFSTFNYLISNPEIGVWMGATPEKLLSVNGLNVETMSLAGTKTTMEHWTPKEEEEQRLVTETIVHHLTETACQQITCKGPETLQAGPVEHLHTKISATLSHPTQWKTVLTALHPTPAVCGLPTQAARQYIPKLEGYNRKFYTGFIGMLSPETKNFFVNLRCMELFEKEAKLYIGGGITAPSEAEAEWNETERKAGTLSSVLG